MDEKIANGENEEKIEDQAAKDAENETAPAEDTVKEPSLGEDLAMLDQINVLKAVLIRMKGGRHPSPQIDALLKRRLDFSGESFQGPYIVRLASTLMMIFVLSVLLWSILWVLASGFQMSDFLRVLSVSMATMIAAIFGIAVFHPSSLPDENQLKKAIDQRLKEMKVRQKDIDGYEEAEAEEENKLVDANFEKIESSGRKHALPDDEVLSSMPEGLGKTKPEDLSSGQSSSDSNQPDTEDKISARPDENMESETTESRAAESEGSEADSPDKQQNTAKESDKANPTG
jgi:low affinity Fe/Cu permease